MNLDLEKIRFVGGPCVLATVEDVDDAATKLKSRFPQGYCKYVTTLGEGILGDFIRVYPPWRILAELDEWRDRIRQYWFWDDGADVLTDEQAEESIIIADTVNGDELIFHPSNPDRLLVLPRDDEVIFEAGKTLPQALEWLCGSGEHTEQFSPSEFEPFDSRALEGAAPSKLPQPTKVHEQTAQSTHQDVPAVPSTLVPAVKGPDQVLREFFLALEVWEAESVNASTNSPEDADGNLIEDEYSAVLASINERLHSVAEQFIMEDFDIGTPCSFGCPAHFGRNGPRIVDVQISSDSAEIFTEGENMWPDDKTRRLFRLVRYGDSWRVAGLWQITKSGRRKRVKMFL